MRRIGLKTTRLHLRPYRLSDFKTWQSAYVDRLPAQNRFDRGPLSQKKCSIAQFKKLIKRHELLAKKDNIYIYGVFERKTQTLVGAIDIKILYRDIYQMANFGYQVHNRFWKKGIGKESARAGLVIGFTQLKLNRLEAAIDLDNLVSVKLAKSIGMRREGIKKNYLFEDGQWRDQIIFVANPHDLGLKPTQPA